MPLKQANTPHFLYKKEGHVLNWGGHFEWAKGDKEVGKVGKKERSTESEKEKEKKKEIREKQEQSVDTIFYLGQHTNSADHPTHHLLPLPTRKLFTHVSHATASAAPFPLQESHAAHASQASQHATFAL